MDGPTRRCFPPQICPNDDIVNIKNRHIVIGKATVERARVYFHHTDDVRLSPAVANVWQKLPRLLFPSLNCSQSPEQCANRQYICLVANGPRDMKEPVSVV
jgi:hypothetical protein